MARLLISTVALALMGCANRSPAPVQDAGSSPSAAVSSAPAASAPATTNPAASANEAVDAGPTACPAGMILVDGDYCTQLALTCEKSWYEIGRAHV